MQNDEYTPEVELDENQNYENEEVETEESEETDSVEDEKDWKSEYLKAKAILDRNKAKKSERTETPAKKSDTLDYGKKAFLTANGIKGSKEFDFVQKELKASGQELEDLLDNDYFQSKLDKFRAINKTANATPTGSRSNGTPTDSVEYWIGKPIEEVPTEMRAKVVKAKVNKETQKGVFYNS